MQRAIFIISIYLLQVLIFVEITLRRVPYIRDETTPMFCGNQIMNRVTSMIEI